MISTQAGVELGTDPSRIESGVYRFTYDRDTVPPGLAVVGALSEVTAVDPIELEALHDTLDVDALDALARFNDSADEPVSVTFPAEGYAVTVRSDGIVDVTGPAETPADDQCP